jgi:HEAT repeat protein
MVNKVFEYVSALEIKDARESVLNLLFEEDRTYVEAAAKVIGKIGEAEDSAKLAEMLDSAVSENTKLYLISALGELNAVQSVSTIVDLAKDTSEPTAVRMAAAEALGGIESPESVESLISIYEDNDANVRVSVIKALSKKTDEKSKSVIISAVKDSFYKVRLAALQAIIDQNITDASSVVLYRAKNDAENVVKHKSYETLSAIHSAEGIWYLMNVIEDNKKSETDRAKAAAVLLKYNFDSSIEPVKAVARATLDDKRLIKLRYAIGKELAKYTSPAIEDICAAYLINDDVATKGTALDMFEKNNFESLKPLVEVMSVDDKEGTNKKKAKNVLDRIERNGTPLTKSSD